MSDDLKRDDNPARHDGPARSSPYPVSRLSPAIDLVDVAKQVQQADDMLVTGASAKLRVIADQIRALQEQAKEVLEETRRNQELHRAQCNFKRQPGKIYHLYQRGDGSLYFSLLAPREWGREPPHTFKASYRLEPDMSWTPVETGQPSPREATMETVRRLLSEPGQLPDDEHQGVGGSRR